MEEHTQGRKTSASGALEPDMINVNTASLPELTQLPGIGEHKAETIVEYRDEHGPFESVNGLTDVKGIGPKTLDDIRSHILARTREPEADTEPLEDDELDSTETAARASEPEREADAVLEAAVETALAREAEPEVGAEPLEAEAQTEEVSEAALEASLEQEEEASSEIDMRAEVEEAALEQTRENAAAQAALEAEERAAQERALEAAAIHAEEEAEQARAQLPVDELVIPSTREPQNTAPVSVFPVLVVAVLLTLTVAAVFLI